MGDWRQIALAAFAVAIGVQGAVASADELPGPAGRGASNAPATRAGNPLDESQVLRQGIVTALSPGGEKVQIHGRWHRIDAKRTQVFRGGRAVDSGTFKVGQTLKFTVAGGQGDARLGVVYVP